MLQSLKIIKRRIRSVENTKKITKAMEMVSGAKLRKSESVLQAGKPYFLGLEAMLKNLLCGIDISGHQILEERAGKKTIGLCVVSSDTGLCSSYNDNIIKLAEDFINTRGRDKVKLVTVGRKAFSYFIKRGFPVIRSYSGLQGRLSESITGEIADILVQLFLSKEVDEVYIVYTKFVSALKYKPTVEKFLNIERAAETKELEYILEPDRDSILKELLPKYIRAKMRYILLNAFTSEHSARMMAMKLATDNAHDMIHSLTLLRNKARQSSITKEIIEVSSAAELLKG
jgi:F-type H+-transporting ATPase subunit gamma